MKETLRPELSYLRDSEFMLSVVSVYWFHINDMCIEIDR